MRSVYTELTSDELALVAAATPPPSQEVVLAPRASSSEDEDEGHEDRAQEVEGGAHHAQRADRLRERPYPLFDLALLVGAASSKQGGHHDSQQRRSELQQSSLVLENFWVGVENLPTRMPA